MFDAADLDPAVGGIVTPTRSGRGVLLPPRKAMI
jgi:hypothetical protein